MNQVPGLQQHYFQQNKDQSDQIFNQELLRQKQNQTAQYGKLKLRDLFPINFLQQKQKFFKANYQYNPHFLYKTAVYPQPVNLSTQYQQLALKILKSFPQCQSNLPHLTQEQVRQKIQQYLDNLGLKQFVQIKFQFQCLSRTSVAFYKDKAILKIRTPLSYNIISLQGVLNHQIGTHILRTLNHRQNCIRKPSQKGKIIQQGLAVINQLLPQQKPFLIKPSIRYLAAIYASKNNFKDIYKKLNKFVHDKDQCWRQCVRVKRGIGNTQEKGGFYKDQNYLIGAVQILKNRHQIDFQKIYYGKLTPQETKNLSQGVLPPFLGTQEKLKIYKKKLEKIALCNFIDAKQQQKQEKPQKIVKE